MEQEVRRQVKKQTVKELISTTTDYCKLARSYHGKDYGELSRKETKKLFDYKSDKKTEIAMLLQKQCDRTMAFFELEDIARMVCDLDRDIENPFEAFRKIIAVFGVEVDE